MAKYLLLYRAPVRFGEQMAQGTPEQAAAGMEGWMTWAGKAGDALVDLGQPLDTVTTVGADLGAGGGFVCGFSIMEADSPGALEALLDGHPHLSMPEGAIEVLEFQPIPGM
jgi:hypothetical protein